MTTATTPSFAVPAAGTDASDHARPELAQAAEGPQVGTHGGPRVLLRIEGALVVAAAAYAYASLGGSWGWFAGLFLVPDLSMLGYLLNHRVGAALYNAGHSYLGPALLAGITLALSGPSTLLLGALIWTAHIGFDRMAGYGLKHASHFFDTHLGRVGRAKASAVRARV